MSLIWCLNACAIGCAGLGLVALVARPPQVRLRMPQVSPRRLLRGCMAGGLLVIAGLFLALGLAVGP